MNAFSLKSPQKKPSISEKYPRALQADIVNRVSWITWNVSFFVILAIYLPSNDVRSAAKEHTEECEQAERISESKL